MAEYYSGRVTSVRFNNHASFYVLEMQLEDGEEGDEESVNGTTTVRGNVPAMEVTPGTWFGFEGRWETHDKYGRQLVIEKAPIIQGQWDAETACKMLEGHGVGAQVCQRLYEHFGENLIDSLADPEKLQEVKAISEFTAEYIVSRWRAVRSMFQSLQFLSDLKLPKAKVDQIYTFFGDDAEQKLSEDPWALVQIDGITFEQADEVSRRLGLPQDSERRLRGAALYTCKIRRGMGHLFLNSGELKKGIEQYLGPITAADLANTCKALHKDGLLVIDNKTKKGTTAIYEPWFYEIENRSAELLAERIVHAQLKDEALKEYIQKLGTVGQDSEKAVEDGKDLRTVARVALKEWSGHSKLELSEDQLDGAVNALVDSVTVLTGLPGTGKTTTLKVLVKVLQDAEIPFLLVAPTGIAAKRMTSVTGADASTIHRAFGAKNIEGDDERESTYAGIVGFADSSVDTDGSREFWGYSAQQPHPAEVVVVDESSMVDQHLLFRLLTCTAKNCRLVFVGDVDQLPSVGPGNVLRDLIESKRLSVIKLTEIFRQDEASDIVLAAHAMNRGAVPEFEEKSMDFRFIEIQDENKILDNLIAAVKKLYEKKVNFQVLSPRHGGTLGVTNLNQRIRELLNPKQPGLREMRLGPETVREGDRIMVSRNNYRFEIFNGDVGKIVRLEQKAGEVEVKIHGPPVMHIRMPFKDAPGHLRMAYTITVHKSQGQEYDVILMPWCNSFRNQLQRNLIYTAITRARKKVILIGHTRALEKAIDNNKVDARNTLFPARLDHFLG
jgi:exodeoxyribonuclease V alpha subunit